MMKRLRQRGQALIMVTIALIAMCGVMALTVDFGWSHFVRKNERVAADAAVMAAVKKALSTIPPTGPFTCTASCNPGTPCMVCASLTPCSAVPSNTNLYNGCQYAINHGFQPEEVQIQASTDSPFETGTGPVGVHYWVQALVTRNVPQLFSAVLGNPQGTVRAVATAAIYTSVVDSSFILLNRQNDPVIFGNKWNWGANLLVQANDNNGMMALDVSGNILLASDCHGVSSGPQNCTDGAKNLYAGNNQGGGTVRAAGGIEIYGNGDVTSGGSATWLPLPTPPGGPPVLDPMSGRGQPPVPTTWMQDVPVPNGVISPSLCPGGVCIEGRYYAVDFLGNPTGQPLKFSGNVTLAAAPGTDGFGDWVFWGGIEGTGGSTVTFEAGRYVYAGALPESNGPGQLIDTATYFTMRDATDRDMSGAARYGPNTVDPGVMFIFTDENYGGRIQNLPAGIQSLNLQFGQVNIQAGNTGGGPNQKTNYINLHGINPDLVPDQALKTFLQNSGVLAWWDQDNSLVDYNASGYPACGQDNDNYCSHSLYDSKSPELNIQASPDIHLYGVVYQPRGAWTNLTAGGGYSGPLQIITGAFNLHANANLSLGVPTNPVTMTVTALIQ